MASALALEEENDRMRNAIHGIRRKASEQTQAYMRTGTVVAAGFALGALESRYGEDAAFGMSPSLAAGIVAHGLAILDVGGKAATPHLMAIGDAGLTVYAFKQGSDMMARYMEEDGTTPTTTTQP